MKHIFKPLRFIRLYRRKIQIDEVSCHIEHETRLLFEAWKYRGQLNYDQRAIVAQNFIKLVKEDSQKEVVRSKIRLNESENTNDLIKKLSFYTI